MKKNLVEILEMLAPVTKNVSTYVHLCVYDAKSGYNRKLDAAIEDLMQYMYTEADESIKTANVIHFEMVEKSLNSIQELIIKAIAKEPEPKFGSLNEAFEACVNKYSDSKIIQYAIVKPGIGVTAYNKGTLGMFKTFKSMINELNEKYNIMDIVEERDAVTIYLVDKSEDTTKRGTRVRVTR